MALDSAPLGTSNPLLVQALNQKNASVSLGSATRVCTYSRTSTHTVILRDTSSATLTGSTSGYLTNFPRYLRELLMTWLCPLWGSSLSCAGLAMSGGSKNHIRDTSPTALEYCGCLSWSGSALSGTRAYLDAGPANSRSVLVQLRIAHGPGPSWFGTRAITERSPSSSD